MEVAIDPKKELFVWGPIEGAWHYISYWALCYINQFPRTYGVRWPEALFEFNHHKMTYICEYEALRKAGWKVMEKWILPDAKYRLVRRRFDRAVRILFEQAKRVEKHFAHDGSRLRLNSNLADLYRVWKEAYFEFWNHGTPPELANWGGEKFLMEALKKRGLDSAEYLHALEVLSAPSELGFFQEEERDLLRIATLTPTLSHQGRGRIAKHTQKYFWLYNSYFETKVLTVRDFERMLREEIKKGNIAERIRDINEGPARRAKAKEQLIRKLKLTPREARVARVLGDTISWQDERKKYVWQANHVVDLWLHEAARQAHMPFKLCRDLLPDEVEQILQGKTVDVRRLAKERLVSVIHFTKSWKWEVTSGAKVRALMVPFQKRTDRGVAEVSGLVVSKGPKVRGTVCLIFSPHKEQARMNKGDILVTGMTSPDYIVVMKRASAIVTDAGGMTSHAAVVSRELGIPCIVGTKVATQVFKDGDKVEVNTEKGIARKI